MSSNKTILIQKIFYIFSFLFLLFNYLNSGSIEFDSPYSNIILNNEGTDLAIVSNTVSGWPQRSIIRNTGEVSNIKTESGFIGDHLAYNDAPTPFIYNNSNSIVAHDDSIYSLESEEKVVRAEATTYLTENNGSNEISSFDCMYGGFILEDSTTSCTYNSFFPVGGIVCLNGGKLYLNSDLCFSNDTTFSTFGIIYANNHVLEYDANSSHFSDPNNIGEMHDVVFLTNSDLTITDTIWFEGDCVFDGKGRSITLLSGSNIVVGSGSTLRVKNAVIKNLSENKIRCVDDSSKLILDNVKWIQTENYTFSIGSLNIVNDVDFIGTSTFFYESSKTLTIASNSTCKFADQISVSFGEKGGLDHNKSVWFEDSSSRMELDNAKIVINPPGLSLTRGNFVLSKRVDVEINSTTTADGLILGDGTVEGDLSIICNPASYTYFPRGHWTYHMSNPNMIKSMFGFTKVVREDANTFYAKTDLILSNITLKFSPYAPLLTSDNVEVKYNKCKVVIPGITFNIIGSYYNSSTNLLDGGGDIFIEEGTFPLNLMIKNKDNTIRGNGSIGGEITLYDFNSELTLDLDGKFLNNIILNNGKLILSKDVEFSQGVILESSGIVDIGLNDFILGSADLNCTSTIYWDCNSGMLALNSKVNLAGRWTFSGDCHLHGAGSTLDLDGKGEILVERGSSLCLKNLNIYGITQNNIRALDDNSKIILDNVRLIPDTDYTFSVGSLHIFGDVDFTSSHVFYYESQNTLTIHKNSELKFSDESTLALGMLGNLENNKPIWWEDSSSVLAFDNSKILVGDSGFRAFGGTIVFSGRVDIDINSTNTMDGMILGDGSESGDLDVIFNPASYVNFNSGALTYDMAKYNGIRAMSDYSKINRSDGQYFYVKHDLVFKHISIGGSFLAVLETAPDVSVGYNDCSMSIPGVKFRVTGSRYNSYTSLLDGNDEIFLKEGIYPLSTLVLNSGNSINGNGSISGQVLLNNSDSELTLNLDGQFLNNIVMNDSKLILGKDTEFSGGALIEGGGLVELGSNDLTLGSQDLSWTSTIYFDSSQATLDINSMIKLYSTWTFSGNCVLKGNNNILWLKPTGQIKIERGSTLELQGIRLKALGGNNLKCEDDSGLIIFNACKTRLAADYNFEKGSFYVDYKFDVKGSYTFNYKSSQVSQIGMCSFFRFFPGTTFSYCPPTPQRDLIYQTGCDACFCLNDATLHSTTTGMQLTRGKIGIYGDSYITSDATCKANGIIFGDGQDENNDINIEVFPGATLDLLSGYLVYKNIN